MVGAFDCQRRAESDRPPTSNRLTNGWQAHTSLSPRFKTNLTATAANNVAEGPVSPSARLTQFAGVSFWIFDVSTFCTSITGTLACASFPESSPPLG